jgi:hypothetical protein
VAWLVEIALSGATVATHGRYFRYYGANTTRSESGSHLNWCMTEAHVIYALRRKRAEIGGHIHDLEKRIVRQRATLVNLDATIRLVSPGANPDSIPPKRAYRRTRYFARNELSRLTQDALRTASGPLTSAEIAAAVMQAKDIARRLYSQSRRPSQAKHQRLALQCDMSRFLSLNAAGEHL